MIFVRFYLVPFKDTGIISGWIWIWGCNQSSESCNYTTNLTWNSVKTWPIRKTAGLLPDCCWTVNATQEAVVVSIFCICIMSQSTSLIFSNGVICSCLEWSCLWRHTPQLQLQYCTSPCSTWTQWDVGAVTIIWTTNLWYQHFCKKMLAISRWLEKKSLN